MVQVGKPEDSVLAVVEHALRDYRVSSSKDESPYLSLQALLKKVRDPSAALAWLIAYSPHDRMREDAATLSFLILREPEIPKKTKRLFRRNAASILLQGLKDPNVADEIKAQLGPLLDLCGHQLSTEEYRSYFKDFETAVKGLMEKGLAALPESLEQVEVMLHETGLYDPAQPVRIEEDTLGAGVVMGAMVIERQQLAGSAFLCTAAALGQAQQQNAELLSAALQTVESKGGEYGRWYLRELGRLPGYGELGTHAARLEQEMAKRGVVAKAPARPEFSHGVISNVDGVGSRSLILFYRTDEGELDAMVLLMNDEVGIKDAYCIWGNAAGMEKEMSREQEVQYVPCSLELGIEFVSDVLALHAELNRPPPGLFLLHRHLLGGEVLELRRRKPRLGSFMLEAVVRAPQMVAGSETLAEHPIYGAHWFGSDEAYAFVGAGKNQWKGRRGPPPAMVNEFLKSVPVKARERLCQRLAVNLETQVLAGRAKEAQNRLAACTWLALTEGVVPFEEIPFVQALGVRGLELCRYNLSMGFRNQDEANRAYEELSELL
ncbi:MAG: hypothetical protein ABSE73_00820 [Planctomycetota bacterium]